MGTMSDTSPPSDPSTVTSVTPSGTRPGSVVGVDIGGSGVKAAVVDTETGELASPRQRMETPHPATPEAVADVVARLLESLGGSERVGVTVPAVVRSGVVCTAANIDDSWIGTDARALFSNKLGVHCVVLNDADAAGVAEMRFGAGAGRDGVVVMVTLGTGIGSAVFSNGVLVPNTELGHMEFKGGVAEKYAASSVRDDEHLSWHHWGHRVGRYLRMLDELFSPELLIVGGGVSKKFDKYEAYIRDKMHRDTEVVPAQTLNQAGIVGAALAARTGSVAPRTGDPR